MQCEFRQNNGTQCSEEALDGTTRCAKHAREKHLMQSYILSHKPLDESRSRHAVSEISGLREEVAIARAIVEQRLNLITNDSELLAACGQVNALLLTIEKLVQSCIKTEEKLGELLSKAAVVELATDMVAILAEELKPIKGYEAIVDSINLRIMELIKNKTN